MKPDGVTTTLVKLCTLAAIVAFPSSNSLAQEAEKKPATEAKKPAVPPQPITEVKREDFRVLVTLPAIFEATKLTPVALEPRAWTDLNIVSIIDHGSRVKKGTRLVQFDLEALEDQIESLESTAATARLNLEAATDGLATLEKTTPLELQAARRAKALADHNLDRWMKTGRDREIETYKRSLAASKRQLEYAQEELNQLQKMYDEDDLTEETEEIILKRAKIGVEQSEYYLQRSQDSHDYAMKFGIPRQHQAQLDAQKQATIGYQLAARSIPRTLQLKRLEIAKAKEDARKAAKKLGDLKRDLAMLKDVAAPTDGVVYYGQSKDGVWSSADAAKKLIPGGKLTAKIPFVTIVGESSLQLKTTIPEEKLAMIKPGARGHVTPVSDPLLKIPARLGRINYASSPLGFNTSAKLEMPEKSNVMPGMKGKLTFVIADRKDVLTAPVTAVFREGNKNYVHLANGEEPEKHEVRVGETDGKKVAVLSGLDENDKILTTAP